MMTSGAAAIIASSSRSRSAADASHPHLQILGSDRAPRHQSRRSPQDSPCRSDGPSPGRRHGSAPSASAFRRARSVRRRPSGRRSCATRRSGSPHRAPRSTTAMRPGGLHRIDDQDAADRLDERATLRRSAGRCPSRCWRASRPPSAGRSGGRARRAAASSAARSTMPAASPAISLICSCRSVRPREPPDARSPRHRDGRSSAACVPMRKSGVSTKLAASVAPLVKVTLAGAAPHRAATSRRAFSISGADRAALAMDR